MTPTSRSLVQLMFFRHGETAWSLTQRHTGRTDLPLTPHGEDQARALRPRVMASGLDRVFSSPRQRAIATCQLSGASEQPEIEPDAEEWDYGDYEGRHSQDIRRERPDWEIFRDGCPNGETPVQISARADRLIARFKTMTGNIGLFSHGQFGTVLAARWIGLAVKEARHFILDPACASVFGFNPDHLDTSVIALLNSSPDCARL